MGWFNNDDELIKAVDELKLLRSKNEALKKELDDITAKAKEDDYACNFLVYFDNIDVFSVERNSNRTIIGYWNHSTNSDGNPVKTTREWYLFCNTDVHEKIVAQYRHYLNNKIDK
jgi:hypothetical protein